MNCRYDGNNNYNFALLESLKNFAIIPVCPEQLGGLTTPRLPAQIFGGTGEDVLDEKAKVKRIEDDFDVTAEYIRGAEQTLYLAQLFNVKKVFLKEKSPACGVDFIKKGSETIKGSGVAAAMFRIHGIEVIAV